MAIPLTMKRPRALLLVFIVFLLHSLAGFYRFGWWITTWERSWQVAGPGVLWYEVNTSFIWGVGSLILCGLAWFGKSVLRSAAFAWMVLLSAGFWIDRLVIMENPSNRLGWPFFLLMNLVIALALAGVLYSPSIDAYLRRKTHG